MGAVPMESYILHLADRIEILTGAGRRSILEKKEEVIATVREQRGSLFHPEAVDAFLEIANRDSFWLNIENLSLDDVLDQAVSDVYDVHLSIEDLEDFSYTLSVIIDSRSKFTLAHSYSVSKISYELAKQLGYDEEKCRKIRVAGLLHDIGKIAVSNEIIEKPGALTDSERSNVQSHVYYTELILRDIAGLEEICDWASNHHENHEGSGYPDNKSADIVTEEMDIIAYADIYTALAEDRPYRRGLPQEEIISIIGKQFVKKHGVKIFNLIKDHKVDLQAASEASMKERSQKYTEFETACSTILAKGC